jgi:hypothetical protein
MNRDQLATIYHDIIARLNDKGGSSDDSVLNYIELIKKYPSIAPYNYVSSGVHAYCSKIINSFGPDHLEELHKATLLKLVMENLDDLCNKKFPVEVQSLYLLNFNRVADEIVKNNYIGPLLHSNDKFSKDLAICSLRMIPVGAKKIHLSRLPKRFLFKKGIMQIFKGIACLSDLNGFSPLYEMHTDSKDPDLLSKFNEKGWKKAYQLIAELLKSNKDVKGVFGSSWFYDPVIEYISPKLTYCRRITLDNGGNTFYLGTDDQVKKDSLLKSKTRRKLYEEGKYLPTKYLLIWSRNELIRWSENIKNNKNDGE